MVAQKGKDLLLKVDSDGLGAFATVAGLRTRNLAFNTESVDVTDSESAGQWRELLSGGGIAVRKGRAAVPYGPGGLDAQMQGEQDTRIPEEGLRPVWVIVVYEVQQKKLIGITEFVFASYQDCQSGAEQAKQELGLHLKPICYVRWMKLEPDESW